MRATYKLDRDVITEFEAQNAGNSISGVQISKIFRGGGNARYWNEPRSRYEAGSAPGVDINSLYHEWFTNFESIVKECIPSQEVPIRSSNKLWMTSSIRTAMHKRDRLLCKYRTTLRINDWNKYKSQRNFTVGIIHKEKKSYFTKINAKLSDPNLAAKNWWKIVKSVCGDKVCSQIPLLKEGDSYINNYFVDQVTTTMPSTVPEISGRFSDRFLTCIEANANEV